MAAKSRRSFLKKAAVAAPVAALAAPARAQAQSGPGRKVVSGGRLFSGCVTYGNLVFVAGKGAHFEGDIKAHTKHVLDEVEKELVKAGSSMEKVLKCNVYLNDLKD